MGLFGRNVKDAGEGVKNAFDGLRGFLDEAITSKEEKAQAFLQLKEVEYKTMQLQEDAATARHKADMQSDNTFSKNIRPLVLVFMLFLLALIIVANLVWGKELPEAYLTLIGGITGTAVGFYFTSRGAEKVGIGITKLITLLKNKRNGKTESE